LGTGCDGRRHVGKTNDVAADGEVVWSRYPDADIKTALMLLHHGLRRWQQSPVTEEITK
jgi:hypothetical protein